MSTRHLLLGMALLACQACAQESQLQLHGAAPPDRPDQGVAQAQGDAARDQDSPPQDISTDSVGLDQWSTPDQGGQPGEDLPFEVDLVEPDPPPMQGCGLAPPPGDEAWTVVHQGQTRRFYVHVPTNYDPQRATPVVLDLHGRALDARFQMLLSGMRDVADANGFLAVHPEGTREGLEQTWNAGLCCGASARDQVDDVGFLAAVLDQLQARLCVDTKRVYATGMSNGGFMAHRLGCELSDRIAAIAPVAGTLGVLGCQPSRPVPVFHFHGTLDAVVPYEGFAGFVSVQQSMDTWVQHNGCAPQPSVFLEQGDTRCQRWEPCEQGAQVQLCTVEGGGHTWPGGTPLPVFGHTTYAISASEMMWTFFSRHSLP